MSSERLLLGIALFSLGACADFRRGETWEGTSESGDVATSAPAPTPSDESDAGAPDDDGAETSGGASETGGLAAGPSFATDVLPILRAGCERCHSADGSASATTFLLGLDDVEAYETTLDFVDLDDPAASRLLSKAAGSGHTGGVIFDDRATEYTTILDWIEHGAMP